MVGNLTLESASQEKRILIFKSESRLNPQVSARKAVRASFTDPAAGIGFLLISTALPLISLHFARERC